MKRVIFFLGCLIGIIACSVRAEKSFAMGEIDGYMSAADGERAQTGYYGMRTLSIVGSSTDTIVIDSIFGRGTVARMFFNMTSADGVLIVKTLRDPGFQRLNIAALQYSGLQPTITHILKTGSIDSVKVYYQKINQ